MRSRLRRACRRCKDDTGQTLLLFAVLLPVLAGCCAIAVDIGMLRYKQVQLQSAADAAALSAALAIPHCDGVHDCSLMQTAALDSMADNGYSNTTLNLQCGDTTGNGVTLTLNNGPCEIPTDPNYGQPVYAEVILSESEPTFFARIFNIKSEAITARSEAKSIPYCMIFSADNTSSSAPPGVQFNLVSIGGNISADCGLADDSGASDAMTAKLLSLFTSVDTEQNVVHGGISTGLLSTISLSPAPQTHAPVVPDPLSYLTPPTPGSCNNSGNSLTIDLGLLTPVYTFSPGTYCGPVTIVPPPLGILGKIVFEPGVYYFKANSLGLSGLNVISATLPIYGNESIVGNGITFYFDSGSVNITGLADMQLTAPTTGPYAGILFYQNPDDTSPMTVIGGTGSIFQGAIYAAGAPLTVLGVNNASYTIIDTGSLNENLDIGLLDWVLSLLSGETFHVGANYSSLPYGSPIKIGSSILVE